MVMATTVSNVCLYQETRDPLVCLNCPLDTCIEEAHCLFCNSAFVSREYPEWRSQYCSARCHQRASQRTSSEGSTARHCLECQEWFLSPRRVGSRGGVRLFYCSNECRVKYNNRGNQRQNRPSHKPLESRRTIPCRFCGEMFTPNIHSSDAIQRYCSAKCYSRHYKIRRGLIKPSLERGMKKCPQCEQTFESRVPARGGRATRFCSKSCRISYHNTAGKALRTVRTTARTRNALSGSFYRPPGRLGAITLCLLGTQ